MNRHESKGKSNSNWQDSINFILILLIFMWPAALPYLIGIYIILISYVIYKALKSKDICSIIINSVGIMICIGIIIYLRLPK